MFSRLLSFGRGSDTHELAKKIVAGLSDMPPISAVAHVTEEIPNAISKTKGPLEALQLMVTIQPDLHALMNRVRRELLTAYSNHVRLNLHLQSTEQWCEFLQSTYFNLLRQTIDALFAKSSQHGFAQAAVTGYIYWCAQNYVLDFMHSQGPRNFDWNRVYPLYAEAMRMDGGLLAILHNSSEEKRLLHKQMAYLLLLVRSLSSDLDGRKVLIAESIIEALHPFVEMSETYGRQTPYGINVLDNGPPTLMLEEDHPDNTDMPRLYFGVGPAIQEITALEQITLNQNAVPSKLELDRTQTPAETLSVLKHLKNRWGGKQLMRKSKRLKSKDLLRIAYEYQAIRRLISLSTSNAATTNTVEMTVRTCEVEDFSQTGYGVSVEANTPWARTGAIVGINHPGKKRWSLGVIRRMVSRSDESLLLGIQILAIDPNSVRLVEVENVSVWDVVSDVNTYKNTPAIYIPPEEINDHQTGLVMSDPKLVVGQTYQGALMGSECRFRILGKIELGADFVHYRAEMQTRSESKT